MNKMTVEAKAALIKLVVFDVDGVLTTGDLHFGPNGEEYKIFHVHDGLGMQLLKKSGVEIAIISSRESPAVNQRMQSLGIEYIYQGQANKLQTLMTLLKQLNLTPEQVAFVGDDLPDLPALQYVGFSICVANAHPFIKKSILWETAACGGQGAAREVCDFIMKAQGTFDATYNYQ